ncbi:MAG: hypothetical protein JWM65_3202 [Sphingomonas bacterium]|nr:hypothetical protein [Sphingomonas bacterium]
MIQSSSRLVQHSRAPLQSLFLIVEYHEQPARLRGGFSVMLFCYSLFQAVLFSVSFPVISGTEGGHQAIGIER